MLNCAFLRGVNLNGRAMKMTDVCEVFRNAGMQQVTSVLATGNIIFQAKEDNPELSETLETALKEFFQMESKLFIKDTNEIKSILDAVPYTPEPEWHIYAFICEKGFEEALLEEYKTAASNGETDEMAAVNNGYFFWRVRKGGTLDTPFSKILGNRKLKDRLTSRNINTIEKVYRKMTE